MVHRGYHNIRSKFVYKSFYFRKNNYHIQKSSAEDEDQFKIEEEVVHSKRLKKIGEYLPKKAKLEKETTSDVSDSKFQVSKGTFERQMFFSLWLRMRLPYFLQ